jgi:lipase chaperone LimK
MIDKNQKLIDSNKVIHHQVTALTLPTEEPTVVPSTSKNVQQQQQQQQKEPTSKTPTQIKPQQQSVVKEQIQNKPKVLDRSIEIMKNWYPLRFKLNFPNKSALNSFEQKDFIEMTKKFHNRTHISQKEVKAYKLYAVYKFLLKI